MFLTRIVLKTGLVDIENTEDGVLAIKAFRECIEAFGIECFTCVALTVDYKTPIGHYSYKERHMRAMRNVTGNSEAFLWGEDKIQEALKVYDQLQEVAELREMEIIKEMRISKIVEIEKEKDGTKKTALLKELKEIRTLQKDFEKENDMDAIMKASPVVNGYTLSRIEQLILNKKSHYHGEKIESKQSRKSGRKKT